MVFSFLQFLPDADLSYFLLDIFYIFKTYAVIYFLISSTLLPFPITAYKLVSIFSPTFL